MPRWIVLLPLLAFAAEARAQEMPALDASASYGLLTELVTGQTLPGWITSATGNVSPLVGITGEIAGGNFGIYSYLGGPRFTFRQNIRIARYAQFLLGVVGTGRRTYFAVQPGGGVDIWLRRQLGIRAAADYHRVPETGDGPIDILRLHFGVVVRTGPR